MSEQVEEIRCRLCATYFPEADRFCPSCREPRPDIHEDLLMAARLTGVSYEILLQRAWIEAGLARVRPPAEPETEPPAAPSEESKPSLVQRLLDRRRGAMLGCFGLLGILLVAGIGLAVVLLVQDGFGGDDPETGAGQPSENPSSALTSSPTPDAAAGGSGTQPAGGGSGSPPGATPSVHVLILNPAVPARFSDGAQIRLIATSLAVTNDDSAATPAAGLRFVASQVEICAGSEPLSSGPDHWRLEMPDGSRFAPATPVSSPPLEAATLDDNDCNSGWLTFVVPTTPNPAYLLLAAPAREEIRFAWDG